MGQNVIIKQPGYPATVTVPLKYLVHGTLNNAGAIRVSNSYRTDAYDVDPAIGSTAMPGFAEWATIYQRFRTLEMAYEHRIANNEAFALNILHGFSPNLISSGTFTITMTGNPNFSLNQVGALTGKSTAVVRGQKSVCAIVGSTQPLYDDLYIGSTTSQTLATAGTVYCHIGLVCPGALVFVAGAEVITTITLWVQFLRPNVLST